MPTSRGRNQHEPASIAMPRLLNTKPMRALVDIKRMSIGKHMVMPTPTAAPLIAATIGFRQLKIASVIESLASRFCGAAPSFQTWKAPLPPEMSAPAQKARPAPVTTMARTSSIAFTRPKKSINSRLMAVLKALSLSGRLSVTVITPSARSVSKVSYFRGIIAPPGSFRAARRNVVARLRGLGNIRRKASDPQSRRKSMSHLLKSVEDGVMKIVLNRPEAMNALSRDMMHGLTDALNEAAGSREIGCVVVRGAGDKAFCAGGDVKSMAAGRDQDKTYEDKVHDIRIRMQVSELLHEMGKPTIAMVNGVAAGAGLSLALAADMRFAGKSARMTTAFAKVGFSGDFGGSYYLTQLVGTAKARELYFTAEILNADQIEKLGLANRVVDDANLENETMSFAKKLAAGPRVAWWHVKKNMKVAEEGSLSEALDSEAARMIRTGETEDHKEAARAFVEKRAPVFKGY